MGWVRDENGDQGDRLFDGRETLGQVFVGNVEILGYSVFRLGVYCWLCQILFGYIIVVIVALWKQSLRFGSWTSYLQK